MTRTSSRTRNQVILLILLLFILSPYPWWMPWDWIDPETRPPADILIWETVGNPDSLDPAVDDTRLGQWMLSNVYETLYTYPFNNSVAEPSVPLLAVEQPSISPDGKNYTIELRQGITFHDGTPFNASCVKWNIERAMKISSGSGVIRPIAEALKGGTDVEEVAVSYGTDSIEFRTIFDDWVANSSAIEILDVYTIRFALDKTFSSFVSLLASRASFTMSPRFAINHASSHELATWENYGVDYGDDENYMSTHACGTGPYTLINWVPDQYSEFDIFGNYWRATATDLMIRPPSYAGAIEKFFVKTNEDYRGRSLDLRAGVSDVVYWPVANALDIWNPEESQSLDTNIHVSIGGRLFETTFFGFNIGNLTIGTDSSTMTIDSPFKNKNFRRTASYAFDYQEFIDLALKGFGIQGSGPLPEGLPGHNGTSYAFDYNITKAVAEWNLAMQDTGFVSSLNSMDCALTLYYVNGGSLRNDSASLLQNGLENVFWHPEANHTGLSANITIMTEELSYPVYLNFLAERRLLVVPFNWTSDYADPISYLGALCYSMGELAQQIGFNDTNVDQWYDLALSENNPSQRQVNFNHIQDSIADEAPYLWAYQELEFRTWREWVSGTGLIFNPMRDVYIYHVAKIYGSDYIPWQPETPLWLILAPFFILIPWCLYAILNYLVTPSVMRKRLKLATFIVCFGLTIVLTSLGISAPIYDSFQSLRNIPYLFTLMVYIYPGLLWVPWYLMYEDCSKEYEPEKSTSPSIDLE